jgi:hypothetical protein
VQSRGSAVGIVTGHGLDDRGSELEPRKYKKILVSVIKSRQALGPTEPPIQWTTRGCFPGIKRPGGKADRSLSTSDEVKKTRFYTSIPSIRLHGVVLS